jgi:hypothetical protein
MEGGCCGGINAFFDVRNSDLRRWMVFAVMAGYCLTVWMSPRGVRLYNASTGLSYFVAGPLRSAKFLLGINGFYVVQITTNETGWIGAGGNEGHPFDDGVFGY